MTSMDCDEIGQLLHAFEDDELPQSERAAVAQHLKVCTTCAARLAALQSLRRRVQATGTFAVPAGLEARVRGALSSGDRRVTSGWTRYTALAASHLLIALLAGLSVYLLIGRESDQVFAVRDVVTAHVRSLLNDQAVQVASADTHTVKPWFMGKVPYAPDVTDLVDRGFPLVGGRLDHVLDRPVAALVYGRRKHRISLFVLPQAHAGAAAEEFQGMRDGYNVVAWRRNGFAHYAVSDLNGAELSEFALALKHATPQ
jgi:anti-sigma factor RsiW